ncbi:LysR family transcriptional regulator [Tatumella citrea]|uniref:LysR family transcriptional regulator n=1 Tax=Tatumella citrea TaxID=53336 RepID=A0A1Y0LNV5_TATCI|nr:LysR family transcriptional regulator [Tatumella citrea]ARU95666.1 LysR family transcriptional regulator [Tatumella citrea]ARU99707.1 LysR family transcriptional regulator [Tatumella citrea]
MFHEKPMSYLYEVGIQGGIRRAADILGINPSVISRQIAQLERDLQLPLLERRGRNVVLTEAGRLLAEDFFESRQRRLKLEGHLKDLRHMQGGSVSIRIGGGLVATFIHEIVTHFSKSYPQVFVEITVASMQEMLNAVIRSETDMAMAFGPIGSPEVKRHSFGWGPVCAVMSPEHPLSGEQTITIETLAEQRLIALTEQFGLQRYMNAMFRSCGLIFTPAYRCNLFSTAMELSVAGLGISCMSARAAGQMISAGKLVAIPIDHPIARESQCHLLRNSDRRFTPAAQHMWQLLRNYFTDIQP